MSEPRKATIITDPVHQIMEFGSDPKTRKALRSVVDTFSFQRLRRISQLGLTSFVFPGATHTRFSHCLGAAFLARQVLNHLEEQETEASAIREYRLTVLLAALLHDVGHGPFSHSFEKVLKGIEKTKTAPDHEAWTAALISADGSDVGRVRRLNHCLL